MSTLTFIILWPLIGAFVVALLPRSNVSAIRQCAAAAAGLSLLFAVFMFVRFEAGVDGYQMVQKTPWVESLGISYHVGVDGINLGMILMGALVGFAAVLMTGDIDRRIKEFYVLLLVMLGGILGAFASLDLFFFYFFHELALVPTFIMIGVWGRGENKNYATFQITLYLSLGALIALIGLIGIYAQTGASTFDLTVLTESVRTNPIAFEAQNWIFPLLMFGFGILVSLWPFHTWAPLGYSSAPTSTAMLHAGVLKKFGLYGLIRIALPILPEGAANWLPLLAFLCLGNIIYCGWVAMRQRDLNWLIGNSSVAHMGFVFLGIASLTLAGVTGAVLVMIAHGLLAALSFGLSGWLYQQHKSLDISQMGGLLKKSPFVGAVLAMALFAGCGLPGFANFAGEILVFFGAWKAYPLATGLACWGALIIGGVYMLRAMRNILHGAPGALFESTVDVRTPWQRLPFVVLLGALILFGIFPGALTNRIKPSAALIVNQTTHAIPAPGESLDLAVIDDTLPNSNDLY